MKRLTCLFAWLLAVVAMANDGVFSVNGGHVVPLKETDVAVTKEVLTISIGDDNFARVDVQYEFTNRGKAKTIDVGFEAQAPYNLPDGGLKTGKHPYIYDFTVEMNGQKLPIRNYVVKSGDEDKMTDFVPIDPTQWRETNDRDDEMCGLINKKTPRLPSRRARMWCTILTATMYRVESISTSIFHTGFYPPRAGLTTRLTTLPCASR